MQCENMVDDLGAYFLQCRRVPVRCTGEATWAVRVNPPSTKSDGIVRLCDHCNRFDFLYFRREKINNNAIHSDG